MEKSFQKKILDGNYFDNLLSVETDRENHPSEELEPNRQLTMYSPFEGFVCFWD